MINKQRKTQRTAENTFAYKQLEQRTQRLQLDNNKASNRANKLQKDNDELIQQISRLKQEVKQSRSDYERCLYKLKRSEKENKSVKTQIATKSSIIDQVQRENESLTETTFKYLRKIEQLQTDNKQLQPIIKQCKLKNVNGKLCVQNDILECNETDINSINVRDEVKEQQQSMIDVYNKHKKVISKWNKYTKKMNDEFKQCKNNMDDEKNAIETSTLLSSYIKCKSLWQQQQNRMESVADYMSQVIEQKHKAKDLVAEIEENMSKLTKIYNEEFAQYSKTRQSRERLQNKLIKKLEELNGRCDEENILNQQKCKSMDRLNVTRIESKGYNSILTDISTLVKEYRQFDDINDENIDKMERYFQEQWENCMKKWYEWNSESIICWIKYLREKKELTLSNEVDLDSVLKQMKNDKMNGKLFPNVDKGDLKSVGFGILSDRKEVFHKIQQLISKYPAPSLLNNNDTNEGQIGDTTNKVQIPKEFICGLSKKIMKNPVKIFDNNTYEKSAIESYLKQYKKSPITQRSCDEDDIWFIPNRKLKQKIDVFLSVYPQYM